MNALHTIHLWIQHRDIGALLALMVVTYCLSLYLIILLLQGAERAYRRHRDWQAKADADRQIAALESLYYTPRLTEEEIYDLEHSKWQD